MKPPLFFKGIHNVVLYFALFALFDSSESFLHGLFSEYDIEILNTERICEQPLNNRCFPEYLVKHSNGVVNKMHDLFWLTHYRNNAIGDKIKKQKLSFEYTLNGKQTSWVYPSDIPLILFLSIFLFGLWIYLTKKLQKNKKHTQLNLLK